MKQIGLVRHVYGIPGDDYIESSENEVFCKREHKIVNAVKNANKCINCPYFGGYGEGDHIECIWKDTLPGAGATKNYNYPAAKDELFRVSGLIDEKQLQKG